METPFKVVPKDSSFVILVHDRELPAVLEFATRKLAEDIMAYMYYAYLVGKQDGIREVGQEIRQVWETEGENKPGNHAGVAV